MLACVLDDGVDVAVAEAAMSSRFSIWAWLLMMCVPLFVVFLLAEYNTTRYY